MYSSQVLPYDRPTSEMTPKEIKAAFSLAMEQMPIRIENVSEYIYKRHAVRLSPSSSNEELDSLPSLIGAVGALRDQSEEEFESRLVGISPHAIDAMRSVLTRKELDGPTTLMVFDGALLWGEAFRLRYPHATWAIGAKPKSSICYGEPVLVGTRTNRQEFYPVTMLHGLVGRYLLGLENVRSLSWLMRMRAYELGFGPNPLQDE